MTTASSLDSYRLLGRSGLRVSPLALGHNDLRAPSGARRRTSPGGAFSTPMSIKAAISSIRAGHYAEGRSEAMTGEFAIGKRDRLVLSTKYSLAVRPGDPNAAGNGRKSMMRSVEDSLTRLKTDYIDLLFLQCGMTPRRADEILRGFDDLVRQGKMCSTSGISDTPAWQVARLQTMAELRGWTQFRRPASRIQPFAARHRARSHPRRPGRSAWSHALVAARQRHAVGEICDGRRRPERSGRRPKGRHHGGGASPARLVAVADGLRKAADAMGRLLRSGCNCLDIGRTRPYRPPSSEPARCDNSTTISARCGVTFDDSQKKQLDDMSRIELGFPHDFLNYDFVRQNLSAGTKVRPR